MRYAIFFIFLLQLNSTAVCQEASYSLRILSQADSMPIAYAHVRIPSIDLRLVSNIDGEFDLRLDTTRLSERDQIVVTAIGYHSLSMDYSQFIAEKVWYLEDATYDLGEVVVRPQDDSARIIFDLAIEHAPVNYARELHQLEFFYREKMMSSDSESFTHLIEATGTVEQRNRKKGWHKITLDQFRKSDDLAEYRRDLVERLRIWEKTNGIQDLLQTDPLKHLFVRDTSIRSSFSFKTLLKDKGTMQIKRQLKDPKGILYEIEFSYKWMSGSLMINSWDYAIVKGELKPNVKIVAKDSIRQKQLDDFILRLQENNSFNFQYEKVSDVYYPVFMELRAPNSVRKPDSYFSDWNHTIGYQTSTLLVTRIVEKDQIENRIRKRNAIARETPLLDHRQKYDSLFWTDYSPIKLTPLEAKVVADLEFEKGLQEQFKQNSLKDTLTKNR